MRISSRTRPAALVMIAVLASALWATPSVAEEAEPAITDLAWYWQDAGRNEQTTPVGTVTVETPNPFCPSAPGSLGAVPGTCAPERLPVWVQGGDYENPYMLAAVAFDVSLIPVGSDVSEFTVTFLEDEAGCTQREGETRPECRETDSINAENQTLQACLVTQLIGGGESRPIAEVPDHQCSDSDPVATRKEIKNDDKVDPSDTDVDHVWEFDLTPYAQDWTAELSFVTGIVIMPKVPKQEADRQQNWRVILAGPKVENGVVTSLIYEPGEEEFPEVGSGSTGGSTTGTTGTTGSTSFPTSGSTSSFDTGSPSDATDFGTDPAAGSAPSDTGETVDLAADPAADEGPQVEGFPAYAWLAILAGIAAFSMMRSVVVEKATGVRPTGALAQIRRLNAERRGSSAAAATTATGSGGAMSRAWSSVKGLFTRKTSGEG